jgi:hypothetical protein
MTRKNHHYVDSMAPHALDRDAYATGVSLPDRLLQLEAEDPFWQTLGGSTKDPWGDDGETFKQRQKAVSLGIGLNIYGPMYGIITSREPTP